MAWPADRLEAVSELQYFDTCTGSVTVGVLRAGDEPSARLYSEK
jgi:hypothetical protein